MTMTNALTSALRIDTLAFAKRLKEAGADPRLAEAIVEGIAVADISHLATRADIAGVRTEIAGVKAELKDEISKRTIRLLYSQFASTGAIVVTMIGGFMALMP